MDLKFLIALAKKGCLTEYSKISSVAIAKELGISQQTASRKIRELEEKGFITREILPRGQVIKFTSEGIETLKKLHMDLMRIFNKFEHHVLSLKGKIISGLGEGRYYMQIDGYRKQFREKLGFNPYPGTLNVKLYGEENIKARHFLERFEGIEIKGFVHEGRTFGKVKCFKAEINGINGAVIFPERGHHGFDIVEFIAPVNVKREKGLKDGEEVRIRIHLLA